MSLKKNQFNISYIFWGILSALQVNFYGLFSPFELISFAFFVKEIFINKSYSALKENKFYKSLNNLLILWIISQSISDFLNNSTFTSFLKGNGAPLLILLSLNFLIHLYEESQKLNQEKSFITNYFLGFSFISILQYFFQFDSAFYSIYSFLKWGGGISLAFIILIFFRDQLFKNLCLVILILISLSLQIRYLVLMFFIYYISKLLNFQNLKIYKLRTFNIFKITILGIFNYLLILLLLFISSPIYHQATDIFLRFSLNPDRSAVLKRQTDRKQSIFNTRLEYFAFFTQFRDSPIIGHGSWAKDKDLKYRVIMERNRAATMDSTDYEIYEKLYKVAGIQKIDDYIVPQHSYIMQSVTWCGLIGASFFFYLLFLSLLMLNDKKINDISRLQIAVHVFHTFFSPLGAHRFTIPMVCLLIIIFCIQYNNNKNMKKSFI